MGLTKYDDPCDLCGAPKVVQWVTRAVKPGHEKTKRHLAAVAAREAEPEAVKIVRAIEAREPTDDEMDNALDGYHGPDLFQAAYRIALDDVIATLLRTLPDHGAVTEPGSAADPR